MSKSPTVIRQQSRSPVARLRRAAVRAIQRRFGADLPVNVPDVNLEKEISVQERLGTGSNIVRPVWVETRSSRAVQLTRGERSSGRSSPRISHSSSVNTRVGARTNSVGGRMTRPAGQREMVSQDDSGVAIKMMSEVEAANACRIATEKASILLDFERYHTVVVGGRVRRHSEGKPDHMDTYDDDYDIICVSSDSETEEETEDEGTADPDQCYMPLAYTGRRVTSRDYVYVDPQVIHTDTVCHRLGGTRARVTNYYMIVVTAERRVRNGHSRGDYVAADDRVLVEKTFYRRRTRVMEITPMHASADVTLLHRSPRSYAGSAYDELTRGSAPVTPRKRASSS